MIHKEKQNKIFGFIRRGSANDNLRSFTQDFE